MQARLKAQQKAWLDVEQKAQSARCGSRGNSRRGPRQSTRDGSGNVPFASACRSPPMGCYRVSYGYTDRDAH